VKVIGAAEGLNVAMPVAFIMAVAFTFTVPVAITTLVLLVVEVEVEVSFAAAALYAARVMFEPAISLMTMAMPAGQCPTCAQ